MTRRPRITIYTDGACIGNPGPGGYGVVTDSGKKQTELSGGFRLTTNNRMEILAVIAGLETLDRPHTVTLYSDSKYVVDAIQKGWLRRWRANRWKRGKAENVDLWKRLLPLLETHQVAFHWVKGHAGNPFNERADQLANAAAQRANLPPDAGYRAGNEQQKPLF